MLDLLLSARKNLHASAEEILRRLMDEVDCVVSYGKERVAYMYDLSQVLFARHFIRQVSQCHQFKQMKWTICKCYCGKNLHAKHRTSTFQLLDLLYHSSIQILQVRWNFPE